MSQDHKLVITRTPLRVSFVGGGTDLPSFYQAEPPGRVIATAINKYLYVTVKSHASIFDERYRISYSHLEIVGSRDAIENDTIRACLEHVGIDEPLYIGTFADIPAASGLGSSSALAVGLLNALYAYVGRPMTRGQLAEEACEVEIGRLKRPIGKQDQYAAAFGGLNTFEFHPDGHVSITPVIVDVEFSARFYDCMALYWTDLTRQASTILGEQDRLTRAGSNIESLKKMRDSVRVFADHLSRNADLRAIGEFLNRSWAEKRGLASGITNARIDEMFNSGLKAGAFGGKLCGAGGGGFLLMLSQPESMDSISQTMKAKYYVPVRPDFDGSIVLYAHD
jgi:D-glycero-alpha-D-manno-heptose-7-phosphate kinase